LDKSISTFPFIQHTFCFTLQTTFIWLKLKVSEPSVIFTKGTEVQVAFFFTGEDQEDRKVFIFPATCVEASSVSASDLHTTLLHCNLEYFRSKTGAPDLFIDELPAAFIFHE
jgi:hypothetical protein